jgi:hypothetical protein
MPRFALQLEQKHVSWHRWDIPRLYAQYLTPHLAKLQMNATKGIWTAINKCLA